MYIQDIKTEFYNELIGKRILVIVNHDIDAICACKILQALFKYDNMLYTLVPVMGVLDLKKAYEENQDEIRHMVLVNCGGTVDVVELLQLPQEVTVFILDSHMPTDVCNIYSTEQVRILGSPEEGVPIFEDIFREDENSDDEDPDDSDDSEAVEGETRGERVQRIAERNILRRREKRQWEESRNKIMFEYSQFSYYGRSSAILVFELAWKLSKDSLELLWWAIVGATEQLVLGKVETSQYTLDSGQLQSHVSRLTHKANDQQLQTSMKISFERDLRLALYRHWSVEASLRHSLLPACRLRLWTLRGEQKLQELLAEMGLPLVQARQMFASMDLAMRKEFHSMVERLSEKYELQEVVYASFTMQYGYRSKFCAADVVYAMLAILEGTSKDKPSEHCFLAAMDCLSRSQRSLLEVGIDHAKKMLSAVFRQVQSTLEMHQVCSAGPFLYLIIEEENPYFSHPHGLSMLAQFALRGHVAVSRNKRAPTLPLIACAPLAPNQTAAPSSDDTLRFGSQIMEIQGMCLVVGVPPVCEDSPKNFFGKAFEQAAHKAQTEVLLDYFDTSVIRIKFSDRTRFLDALSALLS